MNDLTRPPLKGPRFKIGNMVAYTYPGGQTVIKRVENVFLRRGVPGSSYDHWRVQIEGVEAPERYFHDRGIRSRPAISTTPRHSARNFGGNYD